LAKELGTVKTGICHLETHVKSLQEELKKRKATPMMFPAIGANKGGQDCSGRRTTTSTGRTHGKAPDYDQEALDTKIKKSQKICTL
jgi:hypothetical protein